MFLGCGLAAVAGALMGAIFTLSPSMGGFALMKGIAVIILGGMGSITGAVVGGIIIGLIDGIVPVVLNVHMANLIGFRGHHPDTDLQADRHHGDPKPMSGRRWLRPGWSGWLWQSCCCCCPCTSPTRTGCTSSSWRGWPSSGLQLTRHRECRFYLPGSRRHDGGGRIHVGLLVTKLGFTSWGALLISGLAAAFLALLVGFPFMRIRGIYFSLVTVFLAEVVRLTIEQWRGVTGGTMGITGIPVPDAIVIPGVLRADFASKTQFYYLALVLAAFSLGLLYLLERSKFSQIFASIEQADFLADSVGISSARFKVLAF